MYIAVRWAARLRYQHGHRRRADAGGPGRPHLAESCADFGRSVIPIQQVESLARCSRRAVFKFNRFVCFMVLFG